MDANPLPNGAAKEKPMLWTIAIVLILLWAVGFFSAHAFGGLIHLLLVAAVIVMLFNVVQGRRSLV
jgi:membrane protein YdbS with pleckstrin-like domain